MHRPHSIPARARSLACVLAPLAFLPLFGACQPMSSPASVATARVDGTEARGDIAYIRIPARLLTPAFVAATGFNRDHVHDDLFAFGYIGRGALSRVSAATFQEIVELDARSWSEQRFDPRTLELLPDTDRDRATPESVEDYHDYDALTSELQALVAAHPDLAQLASAGKSVQGRELWYLKISDNVAIDEDEPKLLYIANMHGDETVGRELMIYLARRLLNDHGQDARITKIVDHAQIYIMPSMNPDGYELHQRYNADDVDLNRDFPDFTSDPHDTTTGRAVETQAIMDLHARNHFLMAINFHGGSVCFNTPWDTKANGTAAEKFGDDALLRTAGRQYADLNPTMHTNNGGSFDHGLTYGYEWYEVDGGMQDWSIYYRQSIHATVELSNTKWPSASSLPGMWTENQEALLRYLEQGETGAHLNVTGPDGAPLTDVAVRISSANREVRYPTGHIHRPAIGGAQTVTVSAAGYQAQTLPFTPTAFNDDSVQVTLHH